MSPDILYIACAVGAVILSGLAKGGFAGVGALAMPIMAIGVDPVFGTRIRREITQWRAVAAKAGLGAP